MIRCIRLWSGADGNSHFEEGAIDPESGPRGDMLSGKFPIASVSFQQTNADPKLGWHPDPVRQLVITLSGALEFTTHDGRFSLRAGDILFCVSEEELPIPDVAREHGVGDVPGLLPDLERRDARLRGAGGETGAQAVAGEADGVDAGGRDA